jgi:hypothetical protein
LLKLLAKKTWYTWRLNILVKAKFCNATIKKRFVIESVEERKSGTPAGLDDAAGRKVFTGLYEAEGEV